jgi:aryl-alcohol dehydrogenase-like predicted oxidoreductase
MSEMMYRPLGSSGLKASVVGLGTFAIGGWFYGGADEKESVKAIQASLDHGVNLIDTAPIYGYGLSETVVGKAIKGRRDQALLATKVGLVWDWPGGEFFMYADDRWPTPGPSKYTVHKNLKPESMRKELEASLRRLGTDHVDLYQTHWQESTTPIEVTMEALLKLKEEGKIRAIGVSNVTVEQLKAYGNVASAQEKYSLIDRGIADKGLVDYCAEQGIAILSYFTLEQGLLTGALDPRRVFPEGDMRRNDGKFSRENRERVNRALTLFAPIAARHKVSIPQVVIALTAMQRGISHVLIGARNARQAVENAKAGALRLSPEECRELDGIVAASLR